VESKKCNKEINKMTNVTAKCQIEVPSSIVYKFLKESYLDSRFLDACKETKGYVPSIELKEDIPNRKLLYTVAGRDAWTNIKTSFWDWSFTMEEISSTHTKVTINYSWNLLLGILGAGTIRGQASNEAVEIIRGLIALEMGYKSLAK
jgi:hypothetical protein